MKWKEKKFDDQYEKWFNKYLRAFFFVLLEDSFAKLNLMTTTRWTFFFLALPLCFCLHSIVFNDSTIASFRIRSYGRFLIDSHLIFLDTYSNAQDFGFDKRIIVNQIYEDNVNFNWKVSNLSTRIHSNLCSKQKRIE